MIYTSYNGRKSDRHDDIDINSVEFSEVQFQSRWNFECDETNIKNYHYMNRNNRLFRKYLDEVVDLLCAKYSFIDRSTDSASSFSIIIPIYGEIEIDFSFKETEDNNILKFTIQHSNLLKEFIKQKKENISSVKKAVFNEFCMPVILDEQEIFATNWLITFYKKGIATDLILIPSKLKVENINEEYFRVSFYYEKNLKLQLHEQYRNRLLDDMHKCFSDAKLNILGMVCQSCENPSSFPRYYVDNNTKNNDFNKTYEETLLFYMNIIVYDKMRHNFLYYNLFKIENVDNDFDRYFNTINELNLDENSLKLVNYDLINTMKHLLDRNIGFTNDLNGLIIDLLQKEKFLCDLIYIYLHESIYLRLYVLDHLYVLALELMHDYKSNYDYAEILRSLQDQKYKIKTMISKTKRKLQIRANILNKTQQEEPNRCNDTDLISLEKNYQSNLLFIKKTKENMFRFFEKYLEAEYTTDLKTKTNYILIVLLI
ncbi:hypothetical protein COBT_000719 [Conglomerata obtusa]